ncbi:FecCD family ABC transporter permease [Paenibacillus endoradicis]|uniref:FecCD family ABC transporter permease n=1 Tax=Paenibacillus endoradicis TaxID=2972487 RepID=UPI002158B427|nr:iron ABC transporter permease [Paenibacillus endoradicis]MCR8656866.1 iron ABC transporter permease [Paenibacillus endoradicis]
MSNRKKIIGLMGLALLTLFAFLCSIMFGIVQIPFLAVGDAFFAYDGSREQLIILTVRLPRALIAIMIGGSLAVAGCLMQAVSRNALAGPELFGISNGAALAAVITSFWLESTSLNVFAWSALIGAAVAGISVFLISSTGGPSMSLIRFVLAGATLNLLFASLTQGVLILNEQSLDTMRYWLAGSLTGRDMELFMKVIPYLLIGLLSAFTLSKQLNVFALGDEVAQGLGQRMLLIRTACIGAVVLLVGSAVALAGPIGFVGLAVPHISRLIVGRDYRWVVPYSALLGALLLLLADIGARFVLPGQEIPAGIVTAFFGAPILIYLAQRKERSL